MSAEVLFAIQDVLPGKLNALVKNIMTQMEIDDLNEAVRRINAGEWAVKIANLLKWINTITVPAVRRFVCDDEALKAANIGWTGKDFKRLFVGKVEENVPEAKLAVSRLERSSLDAPILTELGDKSRVSLAHAIEAIKKQAHGKEGALLTNGWANIFYAVGNDGNVWAVRARWRSDCGRWRVGADSVGSQYGWYGGSQVLSRDS